nr:hypothetical protein [uncultured Fluviicola sp.]
MKVLYLLLILVVVGTGCEKYNLKQPAYLGLNWRFASTSNSQGNYTITKGYFYSKEFSISGTREKGSPVEITKNLPDPLQKIQFSTQDDLGISLDIPMGDYTEFTLKALLDKTNNPCLRLEGTYTKGNLTYPMIIEWTNLDDLSFKVQNPFFLQKKKNYKIFIGFDVNKLLNISSSFLQSPPISMENGVETVVIRSNSGGSGPGQFYTAITEQLPNALVLTVE